MALTEQHRNTLYRGLTDAVGDEEAVAAMLSQLPAADDTLVTRSWIEAQGFATEDIVHTELREMESRMEQRFATKDFVTAVEHRLSARIVESAAMTVQTVHQEMKAVHQEMRRWFVWSYGAMFVLLVAVVTAAKILE